MTLEEQFGSIDIYLFDQLLKGRINNEMKVLDAGCGYGRNSIYLLRNNFEVHGIDFNAEAIDYCHKILYSLNRNELKNNFKTGNLSHIDYEDQFFDFVISSAVLHFSKTPEEFEIQLSELVRVLKPNGLLFVRLASTIGIDINTLHPLTNRRYHLPDGSDRFLVDRDYLTQLMNKHKLSPLDPVKTSLVDGLRAMTTWVCIKG